MEKIIDRIKEIAKEHKIKLTEESLIDMCIIYAFGQRDYIEKMINKDEDSK